MPVNYMKSPVDDIMNTAWRDYRDVLYRFVKQKVGSDSAAEDIVQDVFLKVCTKRKTLRESSKLKSWLYQITRNTITDYYRSRRPLEAMADDQIPENIEEEVNSAEPELSHCLVPLLDALPAPYRQELKLADFENVKQREIASRLGLSLSGAKSRVQRARRMLRDVLLKCCRVELDGRGCVADYKIKKGCKHCSDRLPP